MERFDHIMIILKFGGDQSYKGQRPFCFFKVWANDEASKEIMAKAYNEEARVGMKATKSLED